MPYIRGDYSLVKVYIDGIEVEVPPSYTILQAVNKIGVKIPTLCYFGEIYREASCRLCLVELENGKLVPACAYPIQDNLKVYTNTPRVRMTRRVVLELILAIHRIRCQSCPRKGGFCELLKLCNEYGVEGIPVCAECPLMGNDCFLTKGIPCLGPLTVAGCNAQCIIEGNACMGCRGPVTRRDVVEEAFKLYLKYNIPMSEVLSRMKMFWSSSPFYDHLTSLFSQFSLKYQGERHG